MSTLDDTDVTKPANATDTGADLGTQIRSHKSDTTGFAIVEHHLTGEHKFSLNTTAARPAAGKAGRIYFNSDDNVLQRDDGSTWVDILYFPRLKIGTYAGDGASSNSITGVGFQPDKVTIMPRTAGAAYLKTDQHLAIDAHKLTDGTISTTAISTLDADGFSVGIDCNASGITYIYIAEKEK